MYSLKKQFKKLFLNEHRVFPLANIISTYIDKKIKAAESEGIEIDESYFEEDTPEIEQLKSKWQNYYSKYSNVIINEIKKDNMSLYEILEIIDGFHKFYKRSGYEVQRRIASGDININNLKVNRGEDTTSNKRTKSRKSIELVEGLETKDYKVIHNGSDWLVIEPKTTQGSIAWAYGLPNGEEEKGKKSRVSWCTASYGKNIENNRFSMYAGNLHMFYFIKKPYPVNIEEYSYMDTSFLQKNSDLFVSYEHVSRKDILNRRICVSFVTKEGEAILALDKNQDQHGSVVNAENSTFPTEASLLSAINNKNLYDKVKMIAKGKKETSFKEVYSKITLSMLKREIITLSSEENKENLFQKLTTYSSHAKSKSVLDFLFKKYREHPEVLFGLLNNNSNDSNEEIVRFCCDLFTDHSRHTKYFSNYSLKAEKNIFYLTINHNKFYNINNTVEKISLFLKDIGNVKNKQSSFSTREKKLVFIKLFFGDSDEARYHVDIKIPNKSHYQKFNFEEVLKEFDSRKYIGVSHKVGNLLKKDVNLYKNYKASKYIAEDCGVDLIETYNCFENKYFIENQLLNYCKNIASGKHIKEKAITNIFSNLNSYNFALKAFKKLGIEENKLVEIIHKSVNKISGEDIDEVSIDIHSRMFIAFCSFFKENQDKRSLYNNVEYDLSLYVKSWLDVFMYKYKVSTWEEVNDELPKGLFESFKYLHNIYHTKWPLEEWDSYEDKYITLDDDYYVIKENMLLKYIRLVLS